MTLCKSKLGTYLVHNIIPVKELVNIHTMAVKFHTI